MSEANKHQNAKYNEYYKCFTCPICQRWLKEYRNKKLHETLYFCSHHYGEYDMKGNYVQNTHDLDDIDFDYYNEGLIEEEYIYDDNKLVAVLRSFHK